jgi:hypothetical protein
VHYGADFDSQAGFADLQTYAVMLPNEEERAALAGISPFLERRLERALHNEMDARGYSEATEGDPDFWISAFPVLPPQVATESGGTSGFAVPTSPATNVNVSFGFAVGSPWGYPGAFGFPYHGFWPYHGFGAVAYPTFGFGVQSFGGYGLAGPSGGGASYPGTIIVEVIDARSDDLVWQGWAENALQEAPEPRYLDEYVDEVVKKILRGFPPIER